MTGFKVITAIVDLEEVHISMQILRRHVDTVTYRKAG